jgi:20S proteasome alpha/beta subunit
MVKPQFARREAVTIIAGFKCNDGVVVCADTQETLGTSKRNVPKLHFEPCNPVTEEEDNSSNLAAAFCGAGDGAFIDKLVTESWNAAENEKNLPSACAAIERTIKDTYREFGQIYQRGDCPEVQLIFGVKMDGKSRLFTAMGPIVNEKFGFDSGGVGHYIADFLGEKMHYAQLTVNQCAILAAYILYEAKEHVEGCGGDSQIAVLRNEGTSGTVCWFRLSGINDLIKMASGTAENILMDLANIGADEATVLDKVNMNLELVLQYRRSHNAQLKMQEHPDLYKSIDFLGLPLSKKI